MNVIKHLIFSYLLLISNIKNAVFLSNFFHLVNISLWIINIQIRKITITQFHVDDLSLFSFHFMLNLQKYSSYLRVKVVWKDIRGKKLGQKNKGKTEKKRDFCVNEIPFFVFFLHFHTFNLFSTYKKVYFTHWNIYILYGKEQKKEKKIFLYEKKSLLGPFKALFAGYLKIMDEKKIWKIWWGWKRLKKGGENVWKNIYCFFFKSRVECM